MEKMKTWTEEKLINAGYTIKNVRITDVDISMADHNCLELRIVLEGNGWGFIYGGYSLGFGSLNSVAFEGYAKGTEYIMRVMDVVGVEYFQSMKDKIIRVAISKNKSIKIIGNIIEDKWFDPESFFDDDKE